MQTTIDSQAITVGNHASEIETLMVAKENQQREIKALQTDNEVQFAKNINTASEIDVLKNAK